MELQTTGRNHWGLFSVHFSAPQPLNAIYFVLLHGQRTQLAMAAAPQKLQPRGAPKGIGHQETQQVPLSVHSPGYARETGIPLIPLRGLDQGRHGIVWACVVFSYHTLLLGK